MLPVYSLSSLNLGIKSCSHSRWAPVSTSCPALESPQDLSFTFLLCKWRWVCSVSGHMLQALCWNHSPRAPTSQGWGHPSGPGVDKLPSSQAIHRPSPAQLLEASLGPDHLHSLTCFSLEASWDPALLVTSVEACAKEELWSPPSQQARARHKADGLCTGRWDTAVKRVGCPSGTSWACSVPRVGGESVTLPVRRIEPLTSAGFEIPLGFYSFIQHPQVPGPL